MHSYQHIVISAFLGVLMIPFLPEVTLFSAALTVSVAVFFGFIVDLDHVLISRLYHGNWRDARKLLAAPVDTVLGNRERDVYEMFPAYYRLLSHLLEAGIVLTAYLLTSNFYVAVASVSVLAHFLSDILGDYVLGSM